MHRIRRNGNNIRSRLPQQTTMQQTIIVLRSNRCYKGGSLWSPQMPEYGLHIICPHCKAFHDAFLRVSLDDSFEVLRVSDVYQTDVPEEFYRAASRVRCLAINKQASQTNPRMMILAEVGKWSPGTKPKDN